MQTDRELRSSALRAAPGLRAALRGACVLALILLASACGPRLVDEPVVSNEALRITLRKVIEGGQPVARGHQHPATVSDVRIAHILASLEYRDTNGSRRPVIRSESVYTLAEALNQAIRKATPDDDIVVAVYETDRRLGLFTNRKVTAFRVFFVDDLMRLEFYDIERELESSSGSSKAGSDGYQIPQAPPAADGNFKLAAGEAIVADGARAVQIDWRDDYFAKPLQLGVRAGRFKRRTVLMEEDGTPTEPGARRAPAESSEPPLETLPGASAELRDAQLRALDELRALRRSGLVSEAEYQRRRQLIAKGELEKAGYPAPRSSSGEPPAQP